MHSYGSTCDFIYFLKAVTMTLKEKVFNGGGH